MNQLLAQMQDLQDKVDSLNDKRKFCDPEPASSSGIFLVPSESSRNDSQRFLFAAQHTDLDGNVFEDLPAREGPFPAFFENPKNLVASFCGLRPGNTGNTLKHGEKD